MGDFAFFLKPANTGNVRWHVTSGIVQSRGKDGRLTGLPSALYKDRRVARIDCRDIGILRPNAGLRMTSSKRNAVSPELEG